MRFKRALAIILIASLLEAILNFRVMFVRMEIILLTTLFLSLRLDFRKALILSCFAGLMKDLIAMTHPGQYMLIFVLLALLINRLKKILYEIPEYISVLVTALALLIYSFFFLITRSIFSSAGITFRAVGYLLVVILVNTILSPFLYRLLRKCV